MEKCPEVAQQFEPLASLWRKYMLTAKETVGLPAASTTLQDVKAMKDELTQVCVYVCVGGWGGGHAGG